MSFPLIVSFRALRLWLGRPQDATDKLLAELKRFGHAAQLEVAGLPAADADEIKQVNVTVHLDLSSFARSKTSLGVCTDGSGRVDRACAREGAGVEPVRAASRQRAGWRVRTRAQEGAGRTNPPPPSSAALADLLLITMLCLKLKEREIIARALLGGAAVSDGSTDDRPDRKGTDLSRSMLANFVMPQRRDRGAMAAMGRRRPPWSGCIFLPSFRLANRV